MIESAHVIMHAFNTQNYSGHIVAYKCIQKCVAPETERSQPRIVKERKVTEYVQRSKSVTGKLSARQPDTLRTCMCMPAKLKCFLNFSSWSRVADL